MSARKKKTRAQLIEAAEQELIANHGYMEISAVARRAHVSAGLTYHHFGSKSGLVAAVVDHFYHPLRAIALGDEIPRDLEWRERERCRTRAIIDYFYDHPLAPVICSRLAKEPEVIDIERAHVNALLKAGARNLAQGQRLGLISMELDPSTAVAMLMGGLRLTIEQAITSDQRPPRQELLDQLWRLTTQALQLDPIPATGAGETGSAAIP